MVKSPFKFLDSYTKEDRDIFFGRDREIEELYQKVFESKILLVCGVSGTGKSSLIDCGLANKFEDSDWLPINIRRGSDINVSLREGISKMSLTKSRKEKSLVKQLESLYLDHFKPIYLIFDQFEEAFIFGNREERKEFIKDIKKIVDSDIQCKLLFVMREEYLAGAIEFEREIPTFLTNRLRIEKMTWTNAKQVIEEPCKVHGIIVEEGLAETILGKLNPESTEVELTYLQVLLDKMYKIAIGNAQHPTSNVQRPNIKSREDDLQLQFVKSYLDKIGDVSDLLGSFLEDQISQLDDPDTGLVILKSFVSIKGTKRQVTLEDVSEFAKTLGKKISAEELKNLVERFVTLRILRDKDENGRYELRHDSLATKIYEKITLVEKELLEVRHFIDSAFANYEKRQIYLNIEDLKYIAPYEDRLFLGNPLKEFIKKSKDVKIAKEKALKRITSISTIGIVLIIIALGTYYYRKAQGKKVSDLYILSTLQKESAPIISLENAFLAYDRDTTSVLAKKAVLDAFTRLTEKLTSYDSASSEFIDPYSKIFDFQPCEFNIISARFSPSGSYIYGWLENSLVKIWDYKGKELVNFKVDSIPILDIEFSLNDKYLAVITEENIAKIYSIEGDLMFEVPVTTNKVNNQHLFKFLFRGAYFAATAFKEALYLYDNKGEVIQTLEGHLDRINGIDVSSDKRFLISASCDHKALIWNFNKYNANYGLYDSITGHRDTVWSAQFNNSGKYIITASSDSTVRLWDLMGNGYPYDGIEWKTYYRTDWNAFIKYFKVKACNAEFNSDQRSILVTKYDMGSKKPDENQQTRNQIEYRYFIGHSRSSAFNTLYYNELLEKYSEIYWNIPRFDYDYLSISPKDNYIALVVRGKQITNLIEPSSLQIGIFQGIQPIFSPDGKYLLCIDRTSINKYLIDIEEIRRLIYTEKIFGELSRDFKDWVPY